MYQPVSSKLQLEHLQPSVIVIVLRLLGALLFLDVIYAVVIVGFFGLNNFHDWHTSYVLVLLLVHAIKYGAITILVIRLFADWAGRAYYLSGHHLIERLGLINITETTYEISQVKSVVLHQSWVARKFNYGTLKLSFAGAGQEKLLTIRDINNPSEYKRYFDEHLQVQGWVR